jgi:hypothetical protein
MRSRLAKGCLPEPPGELLVFRIGPHTSVIGDLSRG